jgi:hypothetical protein
MIPTHNAETTENLTTSKRDSLQKSFHHSLSFAPAIESPGDGRYMTKSCVKTAVAKPAIRPSPAPIEKAFTVLRVVTSLGKKNPRVAPVGMTNHELKRTAPGETSNRTPGASATLSGNEAKKIHVVAT